MVVGTGLQIERGSRMNKQRVAVLGPGSWGTALAKVLIENGHDVKIWGNDPAQIKEINSQHTNQHYLPDLHLPKELLACEELADCVADVDAILFVVPTKAVRQVARELTTAIKPAQEPLIIHASKGLEQESHKRISTVLTEEIPWTREKAVVALSGPSHAEEVAVRDITTITAASTDLAGAEYVQQLFMNEYFRIYTNDDIIGVETGAALKNIIALGAGAIHGLGYGDNAKAAIITRGLAEISRLGVAMGAEPLTFIGLSGVGDLIVTCTSIHSRNWRAGNALGQGEELQSVLANMGMIVEGVATTKAAYELSRQLNVEMPITETIYKVLYENLAVKEAAREIMLRDARSEKEFS